MSPDDVSYDDASPTEEGMDPQDIAPLSEPVYLALLSLVAGPLHGYGIILKVEEWTGGRIRLGTGTLYTALQRLEAAGVVAEAAGAGRQRAGRSRRLYRLTPAGRALVRAETVRLRELVNIGHAVQGGGAT
jgi:DNA-binding PadR family transcriptional regulator